MNFLPFPAASHILKVSWSGWRWTWTTCVWYF